MYRYAAQQIHNEEQQEDSSHSDAHNGGRGEYLTVGNLNHIDTCAREREREENEIAIGKKEKERTSFRDIGRALIVCVCGKEREREGEWCEVCVRGRQLISKLSFKSCIINRNRNIYVYIYRI